jgi:hypothetical protein
MPLYHVEEELASADDLAELSEIEKRNLGQVFILLILILVHLAYPNLFGIKGFVVVVVILVHLLIIIL